MTSPFLYAGKQGAGLVYDGKVLFTASENKGLGRLIPVVRNGIACAYLSAITIATTLMIRVA